MKSSIWGEGWTACISRIFLAVLLVPVFLPDNASAQTGKEGKKTITTTTNHGSWRVTCEENASERVCSATLRVMNKNSQANLLVWLIGRNAEGQARAQFSTPTNILIRPGVQLQLDEGETLTVQYSSCQPRGCTATTELPPELADQLRETQKATISIVTTENKTISFSINIAGIAETLADLEM
jgi:invasion protein IalB